jgi:TonB family protein
MAAALTYQPAQRWRICIAFLAATAIHLAALKVAGMRSSGHVGAAGPDLPPPIVEIEDSPADPLPPPDLTEPQPPATPEDSPDFVEENRRPLISRPNKSVVPLVRPKKAGGIATGSQSAWKVLAINAPRPEYPYEARRGKITGAGVVMMTVDATTGNVSEVSMSTSTGSPVLDNATVAAFRKWRFKPGTVTKVQAPITYTLTGSTY